MGVLSATHIVSTACLLGWEPEPGQLVWIWPKQIMWPELNHEMLMAVVCTPVTTRVIIRDRDVRILQSRNFYEIPNRYLSPEPWDEP